MASQRLIRLALAGGGALALSGGVIAITAHAAGVSLGPSTATAAAPTSTTSTENQYCQTYLDNFAKDLGKRPEDVRAAAQKALGQTLDQAVKDGKLTSEQAKAIKDKASGADTCAMGIGAIGHRGAERPGMAPGPGPGMDMGHHGLKGGYLGAAAAVLGMSEADLMTALKGGHTMQELASGKGLNEQQFRDQLTAQVKTDLDAKVKSGAITQAQEDEALKRQQNGPLPFWSLSPKAKTPGVPSTQT